MKLITLIESLIFENFQLDQLKEKYVGDGKPLSDEDFQNILEVCNNKHAYVMFLTTRVANKLIMMEDVYKFKNYFMTFEKNKSLFDIKDISQYKTPQQIDYFKQKCISIAEKDIVYTQGVGDDKDNYVSPNDIRKLELVGIKYLGIADGFQIFQVPGELKGNRESYETYKTILGRCAGRDQGAKIDICTIGSFDYFNRYFEDYPDSSYFVMFNLGDPLSPYQIHFESNQFKDKNDKEYGF